MDEAKKNTSEWYAWSVAVPLIFIGMGLYVALVALDFGLGKLARPGPGVYPLALGIMLALLALACLIASRREQPDVRGMSLRPALLVPAALVVFGLCLERFGLIPATVIFTFVAGLADREARSMTVLITAAFLSLTGVLVFIYGLGVPVHIAEF
ncbi:tripartite tricarboxylate transporter TctB family protein [Rhodobacteraceae bacterium DSL-40]|uniref:tripartite tricarboxylate transporter TctB family protein n=1 Tax=Amaricoccus sp. B4 TaxID=3368557 RepID=UPI0013A6DD30